MARSAFLRDQMRRNIIGDSVMLLTLAGCVALFVSLTDADVLTISTLRSAYHDAGSLLSLKVFFGVDLDTFRTGMTGVMILVSVGMCLITAAGAVMQAVYLVGAPVLVGVAVPEGLVIMIKLSDLKRRVLPSDIAMLVGVVGFCALLAWVYWRGA